MNTRYSTFVEYGFTTLYTPNHGICHNICGTLNISFVVDRVSDVSKTSTAPTGGRTPSTRDTRGIPPLPHLGSALRRFFYSAR